MYIPTVNPQERLAVLIHFQRLQMRVSLEFGYFSQMFSIIAEGLFRIRVSLEGQSHWRIYGTEIP